MVKTSHLKTTSSSSSSNTSMSIPSSPTSISINSSSILTFIRKLTQIIIRARLKTQDQFDSNSLTESTEFWRNGLPVHIDIYLFDSKCLLERWVVSFEQKSSSSSRGDDSELILLAQSLYSHIRFLPLHSGLNENYLKESDLCYSISIADGTHLSPTTVEHFQSSHDIPFYQEEQPHHHLSPYMPRSTFIQASEFDPMEEDTPINSSTGFNSTAKLKVYKFNDACTKSGKLHLSVIYDTNLAGLLTITSPTKALKIQIPPPVYTLSIDFYNNSKNIAAQSNDGKKRREPILRQSSPFPSPTMKRNILMIASKEKSNSRLSTHSLESTIKAYEESSRTRTVSAPLTIEIPSNEKSLNEMAFHMSINRQNSHSELYSPNQDSPSPQDPNQQYSPIEYNPSQQSLISANNHAYPASLSQRGIYSFSPNTQPTLLKRTELFGTLVGSYEESILSGRMSQLPSKPIQFYSDIGVLGSGKCKAALKCPSHILVDFLGYFYDLEDEGCGSPYVGLIDIGSKTNGKGYRIPRQGQIQIMIKNACKTIVKVFLVPYDLKDMKSGQKTFQRQKIYGTTKSDSINTNEHMRFAIHLQFMCDQKGNMYLGKMARVVFSQRGVDGDERLRIVNQEPTPKYAQMMMTDMQS